MFQKNLISALQKRLDVFRLQRISTGSNPPNPSDLSAWYFSKGLTADGMEVINSKGDNAKVVQRLCAKGDGATGKIVIPTFTLDKTKPAVIYWSSGDSTVYPLGRSTLGNSFIYHNTTRLRLNWNGVNVDADTLNSTVTGNDINTAIHYNGVPSGTDNFYFQIRNISTGTIYDLYVTADVSAPSSPVFDSIGTSTPSFFCSAKIYNEILCNQSDGILCIGDSNTAGLGYPNYIQSDIAEQKINAVVLNNGINGKEANEYVDNSVGSDYETYIKTPLSNASSKYVIFQMGLNDINHGTLNATQTWTAIDAVYDNMIADGINIIACTIPYRLNDTSGVNAKLDYVNAQILASNKPEIIVDLNATIGTNASYFTDNLHLNATGQGIWADLVMNAITLVGASPTRYYPLEGSTYDISGNNDHGTASGTMDFTQYIIDTDGIYSPNINNGFDLYYDDATGLIPLYVPYISGSPVVASVASYTKDSEHPQETVKINNLADVYFDLGLDKSDVTKFNATCRASVHYNSSHPTFWHASELTPVVMQSYLESAGTQFNTLFSATTLNQYVFLDGVPQINPATGEANVYEADVNNVRDLFVYKATRTESEILRIMKYTKNEVGL